MGNVVEDERKRIITESKLWGFANHLNDAWWIYEECEILLQHGSFPSKNTLTYLCENTDHDVKDFDTIYFSFLPIQPVNPLPVETEAWKLLSPQIRQFVTAFGTYLNTYAQESAVSEQLQAHLIIGKDLLEKWNIISDSWKAKYEGEWDTKVPREEESVKELIEQLQLNITPVLPSHSH